MWIYILKIFYLMLPAYFANMAPVIMKKSFSDIKVPIDLNKKLWGKPLFGKNKTYRGLIFGIIFAIIVSSFQFMLYSFKFFKLISMYDYGGFILFGFLMGFGAIFGDLAESFIKRRISVKPGARFVPWDQWDFVIGAILFSSYLFKFKVVDILSILAMSFILHIIVNHISHYLGFRENKW